MARRQFWTSEMIEKLYQMYRNKCTNAEIVAALNLKNQEQVSAKIMREIKAGNLEKIDRTANRGRSVYGKPENKRWGASGGCMTGGKQPIEIATYEENGITIRVYEPRWAQGAIQKRY